MDMNIVIHFNAATTGIQRVDEAQTWGKLCQHFCETKLLHPPQLLQLLTSLHPDGRMSRYKLRYGDGYATIVCPIWNEDGGGLNASVAVNHERDVMVEANVILKPRNAGGSASFSGTHQLSQATVAANFMNGKNGDDKMAQREKIDMDLWIEKVGEEDLAGMLPFPLTQTPFPTDDSKMNMMFIREHPQFKGVVDKVSIEKANDTSFSRECADKFLWKGGLASDGGDNIGSVISDTKHRENPHGTPTKAASGENRAESQSTKKSTTKEGGENERKQNKGKMKKKSSKMPKASKESVVKEKKSPKNSNNKTAASTAEDKPTKKSVSGKSQKKASGKSQKASGEKTIEKDEITSPDTTAHKSPRNQKEQSRSPSATLPLFELSTKKVRSVKKGEDSPLKEENQLKRPPNGYMMFASDVRPKLREEHPKLKVTEMSKKIGEMYRALGRDEKKKYSDAAKKTMDDFKEEHPNLPKSTRKKRKKEQAKEDEEEHTRKKIKKKQAKEDDEEKHESKENVAMCNDDDNNGNDDQKVNDTKEEERPKKPLNGYMRFSMEIRSKIKEENPDASSKEIMSKAGEAYRALDDDVKQQYKDAADAALVKFKEEYGDDALKNKSTKKKKKRQSKDGAVASHPTGIALAPIPAEPAVGMPGGWTIQNIPRKTGDHSDKYWFSPAKSFKFRSKAQVKRFLEILENTGGGDEVATMELYSKGEKEKSATDKNSSGKKRETMSDKKKERR